MDGDLCRLSVQPPGVRSPGHEEEIIDEAQVQHRGHDQNGQEVRLSCLVTPHQHTRPRPKNTTRQRQKVEDQSGCTKGLGPGRQSVHAVDDKCGATPGDEPDHVRRPIGTGVDQGIQHNKHHAGQDDIHRCCKAPPGPDFPSLIARHIDSSPLAHQCLRRTVSLVCNGSPHPDRITFRWRFGKGAPMVYNHGRSGRSAVRLARTVRVREVGGSSPLAPTGRHRRDRGACQPSVSFASSHSVSCSSKDISPRLLPRSRAARSMAENRRAKRALASRRALSASISSQRA